MSRRNSWELLLQPRSSGPWTKGLVLVCFCAPLCIGQAQGMLFEGVNE